MPRIKAGDIELEYFKEGSGPPLLMIMGFAGSASSWGRPFIEAMQQNFTCIRISNRGTGESDKPDAPVTCEMMAEDAVAVLDALGIERPHLMGISMGGYISQELAIKHPQRVNGLVLGCTGTGGPKAVPPDPIAMTAMTPGGEGMTPEELIRKSWPALISDGFVESGARFLDDIVADFLARPTPLETLFKQMGAIMQFDVSTRDHAIKSPTLVIHGTVDRLVQPPNGVLVAEAIPGATHRTIEGVGHMFFWEKPQESAEIVTEFLARVPAAA